MKILSKFFFVASFLLLLSLFLISSRPSSSCALAQSNNNQAPTQKQVPVIGILISPMQECNPAPANIAAQNPIGCIESYYARWLEASAARIIPIPWQTSQQSQRQYLLERVNGVLFPGGGLWSNDYTEYMSTLQGIVDYALDRNENNNDPFFLWGTCFGFQLMARAVAKNQSVVTGGFSGMYPLMMALNFTSDQPTSRIFGTATTPSEIISDLKNLPTTLNWHHAGILPSDWYSNPVLPQKLRALSTNTEPSGEKSFISSYEGATANIFASQFHPERPEFEFTNPGIGHSRQALAVSRYIADFVIARAKLNSHTFENPDDSEKLILESHPRIYQQWGVETFYILGNSSTKSGVKEFDVAGARQRREELKKKNSNYDL